MSDAIIASEKLKNGLELAFLNQGNRYFGDYHQVKVIVSCRIEVSDHLVSEHLSAEDVAQAQQIFGPAVEYRRLLKQMGVAGAEVAQVELALVERFKENAMSYMQGDDFAARFVARRLAEHRSRGRLHLVKHD